MAVTLIPSDLLQPNGELAATYFPDADLNDQLDGWLIQATAKVEANADIAAAVQNDASAAWVYYLAYSHIANRIGSMPSVVSVGSGEVSRTYAQDRPAYWLARAQAHKAAYAAMIVPVAATVTTPRDSMSVPVVAIW